MPIIPAPERLRQGSKASLKYMINSRPLPQDQTKRELVCYCLWWSEGEQPPEAQI